MTTLSNTPGMPESAPLPGGVRSVLRPRPRWSVSQWAVRKPFRIAEKGAASPGPYDLSLTPFWREVLDCPSEGVTKCSVVASSQIGKTLMGLVKMAWFAEHRPVNQLYVRPNDDDVVEGFRDRWHPTILNNLPHLIPGGEWLTTSKNPRIALRNCYVYGAAATVPRQLTSRTAGPKWFDEIDSGGEEANSLGNVEELIDERSMALSPHLIYTLGSSTPKFETGSNWRNFEDRSDGRRYHEPCPCCGSYQVIKIKAFEAHGGESDPLTIQQDDLARLKCKRCGTLIGPVFQGWMADRGIWVPRGCRVGRRLPVDDPDIRDRRALTLCDDDDAWRPPILKPKGYRDNPHRGYHVWRASAKFPKCRWSNLLAEWIQVNKAKDPAKLQVYINNTLAEAWKVAKAAADEDRVRSHVAAYPLREVPTAAKVLLASVDVQADHLWYLVKAVGVVEGVMVWWTIDYGQIEAAAGDHLPALETLYERLFFTGYPLAGEPIDGLRMGAYAMAVDAGYMPDGPYELSRRPGVIPVKGTDIADWRVRFASVEAKGTAEPVRLCHVNKFVMEHRLERLINVQGGGPNDPWRLPADTTEDYIEQIASHALRPRKSDKKTLTWQSKTAGRPDHLRDCEAYIQALAEALEQVRELSLLGLQPDDPPLRVFRPGAATNATPTPTPPPPPPSPDPAGESWLPPTDNWHGSV
ncbi:MAG: terminase gpA endonuclease subunit [Planctomycetota bacterium]